MIQIPLSLQILWKTLLLLLVVVIFIIYGLYRSSLTPKYHPGGPYYYGDFALYAVPYSPKEELSKEQAVERVVYFIAYFDNKGRIISFTKCVNGIQEWTSKFYYHNNDKLEHMDTFNADNTITQLYCDEKGHYMKTVKINGNVPVK
jgi:hypothetical protein